MADEKNLLKRIAQNAIDVQTACNLCGVLQSWAKDILELRRTFPQWSTEDINRHPVNRLFSEQVLHLAGGVMGDADSYREAFKACEELATNDGSAQQQAS